MFITVLCTCGKSIGAYFPAFKKMREIKIKETLESQSTSILSDMMILNQESQPLLGEVLDMMNITLECCRQKFLTTAEFSQYY
jgi:DNA-directed RNA polymerase subunit N (RpoN/RPB10)